MADNRLGTRLSRKLRKAKKITGEVNRGMSSFSTILEDK